MKTKPSFLTEAHNCMIHPYILKKMVFGVSQRLMTSLNLGQGIVPKELFRALTIE